HRDLLAGATAQAPPDAASSEDADRHLMMKSHSQRRKAVPLSARSSAGRGSRRSDDGFTTQAVPIFTAHWPGDHNNASFPTCINSLTAQLTLAADSAVARPRPNPHSERAGTA